MLRRAGISWQSRRLVGRVHGNGALVSAAHVMTGQDGSDISSGSGRNGSGNLRLATTHLMRARALHSAVLQLRSPRNRSTGLRGDVSAGHGQDVSAAWRGALAAAGASLGAKRRFWGRSGGDGNSAGNKGNGGNGGEDRTGFPEAGGAADGDSWSPPPDAWMPDEAPPAMPQDAPRSGFDVGGGSDVEGGFFADSSSMVDAVAAAAPDSAAAAAMAAAGLSAADLGMWPSHLFMQAIEYVQASAGVPYWEAIMIVSVVTKIAMLPVFTYAIGASKRMNVIRPQMLVLNARIKEINERIAVNPELREAGMREMQLVSEEMSNMLRQHGVSIPKMFLAIFAQFPVFLSLFLATRDMGTYFPGYMTGGLDWLVNLSVPDPTWTLPILTSASLILLLELGADMPVVEGPGKPIFNQKQFMRIMGIVSIPLAFTMPAGVLVYWTTNNIVGILQKGLFELGPVQRALGWPMPEDMPPCMPPVEHTGRQETPENNFASKEDLERWGGGGEGASSEASRGAAAAAERAREAVAKASKVRHEQLKREHKERSGGDRRQ